MSPSLKRLLAPRKTLTDLVYKRIKDDIVNGVLKPGESTSTGKIAREMGVGPMSVRTALSRLHAERLLVIAPQRGVTVTDISPKELEEAFAIRSRLEGLGAYLACQHISEAQLRQLRAMLDEMQNTERSGDTAEWIKKNHTFHQLIFRVSQNRKLEQFLLDLWSQVNRGRIGVRSIPGHMQRRNQEHESIVKALESRQAKLADRLMQNHIRIAGKEIIEFITKGIYREKLNQQYPDHHESA